MKALLAIALVGATLSVPALASGGPGETASVSKKKVCTELKRKGGSRLALQRVCLTADQWREKLGADWRQVLAGRSLEDDMDSLAVKGMFTGGNQPKPNNGY